MHRNLDDAGAECEVKTEVCVVGSGVAGITATRKLLELGHSVTILESGGIDYEHASADLNIGENIGAHYYELRNARLRMFGGTTAIWGGRLAQMDPIDLERRSWVPNSGWPISWSVLQRYYAPARLNFGDAATAPTQAELRAAGAPTPDFDPERLEVGVWSFDGCVDRFAIGSCADLVRHPRCIVVTHATVTRLQLACDGRFVEQLTARSIHGGTLTVQANAFILAAGGLENPRLLLASNDVAPAGIGNAYDQVGRYFMEHPHSRGGRVVTGKGWMLLKAFGQSHRGISRELAGLIKPSPRAQAAQGILNSSLTITARQPPGAAQNWGIRTYSHFKHRTAPTRSGRAIWMTTKKASKWVQRWTDPFRPWALSQLGLRDLALLIRAEQSPNPLSRVLLTSRRDSLDVFQIALDWRTTALDVASAAGLVRLLDEELRRLELGRIEPARWLDDLASEFRADPLISAHPIGGYHHMGTTRMSDDPRRGVTDPSSKVHGVENLYVAGSSVFPTSGWANPTLTIVALTLRTAEIVSRRLRNQSGG